MRPLVLGLKSPKRKNVPYRFVFKVAKIQLEPLWISTNRGELKAIDKAHKKGTGSF